MSSLGATAWAPWHEDLTERRVREAELRGLRVIAWTVNDPDRMTALIDMGVDAIVTDYPDILRDVLRRRGAPLPEGTRVKP